MKPSHIYAEGIGNIECVPSPSISTIRDCTQIYNARRNTQSTLDDYLGVLKNLENSNSIVARFSMARGEAPVIVLSQKCVIQELNRCCVNPPLETAQSILCKSCS